MNINNKIFITGASGGIGSAICHKFHSKNNVLILTSSSDEKIEILKSIYGKENHYYKLDLSDPANLQNSLNEISKDHKDISVIINNAGTTQDNLIFRMKDDQWSKSIANKFKLKLSNYKIFASKYVIKQVWKNYWHLINCWVHREPWTGKLCCI